LIRRDGYHHRTEGCAAVADAVRKPSAASPSARRPQWEGKQENRKKWKNKQARSCEETDGGSPTNSSAVTHGTPTKKPTASSRTSRRHSIPRYQRRRRSPFVSWNVMVTGIDCVPRR